MVAFELYFVPARNPTARRLPGTNFLMSNNRIVVLVGFLAPVTGKGTLLLRRVLDDLPLRLVRSMPMWTWRSSYVLNLDDRFSIFAPALKCYKVN